MVVISCQEKPQNKQDKTNNHTQIDSLINLGELHFDNVNYDSSYFFYNKSKSLCNPKTDHTRILYSLYRMSEIQQNQGDYAGSESTATEALPFLKNNIDPAYECSIYNLLGIVNVKLFDYDNALYYYNKGLHLKIDKARKLKFQHNIAVVYINKKDYHRAIQILLPLISRKEIIQDTVTFSKALENLGYSYYRTGNQNGIDYMNQALKIKKQTNDHWGMVSSYLHLSEYYKDNPSIANKYASLAYEKATKVNNVDERLESLSLLIENSAGNQSKIYSKKYIQINDSIKKVRQKARNQFAKIKYDSKKEKEENSKLKTQKIETALELEQHKNRNLILIFLVITGILSTIFLYYFLKALNKKEKIQISYDTETRISKRLHDELANDVFHTLAFAETQDLSTSQNKEILLNNLDAIYSRTRNISKENSAINTGKKYLNCLKEMMSGFNTDTVTIITNGMDTIDWDNLEVNKKIIIYRVIQELLVNMKKHSQCSLAAISFKKNEKKLQIDYSDNGLGASLDKINSRNGLQNVENRILAIKGTITFDTNTNKGFKTSFSIPI
ncbi:tetratricopeptide repeat-containing sensor histidine kinase [Flavobacterium eburneipallidum]|uniref:tetratricopeptide repeat-containing sensor histidine kinase n=1 Tax=Flavobacterium eburneipallidum TaxID=3003263 RepID=UPI002482AF32|nr:ATP-binding protein [Flavobacterium eburneipallidum]